jgi:hypothetical protein
LVFTRVTKKLADEPESPHSTHSAGRRTWGTPDDYSYVVEARDREVAERAAALIR